MDHSVSSKGRVACGVAVCIYDEQSRLLMIKRTGAHGEGTWSVPGGWVDAGEGPLEAAKREVWEEVGLTAHGISFKGFSHSVFPEGVESVCLWFLAEWAEGQARAAYPDRIADIGWYSRDHLPFPLFKGFSDAQAQGISF